MAEVRPIQAVIFDAAGTLIETAEPVGEVYAREARSFGVELPASRIEEAFRRILAAAPPPAWPGASLREAAEAERRWWWERVRETFRAADGTVRFDDFDGFFDRLFEHYAHGAAWRLRPGAREALVALRRDGLQLAVLSNFDQRLRPVLRELGIHGCFDAVTLPADAGAAKPARQIFDVCLKRLGVANHRCVYVGDHAEQDLASSKTAGLHSVDVASLATLAELPARVALLEETLV